MELLILAVVAGISFASYALWRQARGSASHDPRGLADGRAPAGLLPEGERTIHTLRPGDVVSHLGTDYLVEGVLALDDDGRVTRLSRLVDGSRVCWLGARPGSDSPLLLDEAPELTVESNGPEAIVHRGLPFRLTARESALAGGVGSVGAARPAGRVQLYEYSGAGVARVIAVAWPARVEAFRGEQVEPHLIEILPGSA